MIKMNSPKGGEPIYCLPQKVDEMLEKGWTIDKPSKPNPKKDEVN